MPKTRKRAVKNEDSKFNFKQVKGRTAEQESYLAAIETNDIVLCQGVAGTGKTYLAVYAALKCLFDKTSGVDKVSITRPIIETGAKMGHLPGTFEDKLHPYLLPIIDALHEFIGPQMTTKLRETGVIEIAPLAYMRGRTFKSTFMILDEAQNSTAKEILMYATRIGDRSRMVITGDGMQSDIAYSGFNSVVASLQDIPGIATMNLPISCVQRHKLVPVIIERLAHLVS